MYCINLRASLAKSVSELPNAELLDNVLALPDDIVSERIIFDERTTDMGDMATFLEGHAESRAVFVVDEITPVREAFATSHKMELVRATKLVNFLQDKQSVNTRQPVMAFWGVLPQLGTSTLALATARRLSEQGNVSVGVIACNAFNSGAYLSPGGVHRLDDLRSFIHMKKLSPSDLREQMDTMPGGYQILLGLRNQSQCNMFQPKDIAYLVSVAKQAFEVVVLDVGSILTTPLALQSLIMANLKYAVVTDLLMVRDQFNTQLDTILKPLGIRTDEFLLIGNKLKHQSSLATFAKSIGVPPLAGIPAFPELPYYTEHEMDILKLFLGQKKFAQAIDDISAGVIKLLEKQIAV